MNEPLLSPRVLGDALGVSESSLKRWADEGRLSVERTAGGHRRIRRAEAVRFIRESGIKPVRPELLALPGDTGGAVRGGVDPDDMRPLLTEALGDDRTEEVRGLLMGAYLDGASLAWLCDEVVQPALEVVGELWREGPRGILVEHRATESCGRVLAELQVLLPAASAAAPVAVGGAFSGDVYRLPSAMAAAVLADSGYRVYDLGPDTPVGATLAAIERYGPSLVWQSFSVVPAEEAGVEDDLERIAQELGDGRVVVGGRASHRLSVPRAANLVRLGTMRELRAFALGAQSEPSAGE